jgi:hypothetical protein
MHKKYFKSNYILWIYIMILKIKFLKFF